nr:MAG TPA: hypothetical protein [Caudoviricetes sp.]
MLLYILVLYQIPLLFLKCWSFGNRNFEPLKKNFLTNFII